MIYHIVNLSPPSPPLVPPENDNDDDEIFGEVVLFLDAAITQSMKKWLMMPTPKIVV